jgi:hypothetical protein
MFSTLYLELYFSIKTCAMFFVKFLLCVSSSLSSCSLFGAFLYYYFLNLLLFYLRTKGCLNYCYSNLLIILFFLSKIVVVFMMAIVVGWNFFYRKAPRKFERLNDLEIVLIELCLYTKFFLN